MPEIWLMASTSKDSCAGRPANVFRYCFWQSTEPAFGRRPKSAPSRSRLRQGIQRLLWDKDREFSTRLGEESVDVYLARKGIDGQLRPLVDEIDFCWEKPLIRPKIMVAKLWYISVSDEETLTCFRKRHHRPSGHIVLVSEMGKLATTVSVLDWSDN